MHLRPIRTLLLGPLALALACATPIDVTIEPTAGVDVSQWRTYVQAPPPAPSPQVPAYDAAVAKRIQQEIATQLDARGYRNEAAEPDLRVAFRISSDQMTRLVLDSDPDANFYVPEQYVEGMLVIEVFEQATETLVWAGVGRKRIFEGDDPGRVAARAVQAILAELPPSTPRP